MQGEYAADHLMVSIVIVTIDNPKYKYIWVPARAELKLELEPHLEVRQNAVAPVAGAKKDLRGSVTLLHAVCFQQSFAVQPKSGY